MSEEFCEVEVSRINRPKIDASKIDQGILDLVSKMNLPELSPEVQHEPGTILIKCNMCNQPKSLDEFSRDSSKNAIKNQHGRQKRCKPCCVLYKQTPLGKSINRNTYLKNKYNIDHYDYETMLAAQDGRCAICKTKTPGGRGRFHVDHCHITGKIRGLLCNWCNTGIGQLKHNPALLRAGADYLEKHAAPSSPPAS